MQNPREYGFVLLAVLCATTGFETTANAQQPIGTTCIRPPAGSGWLCTYPNGTIWTCDESKTECTRIGLHAPETGAVLAQREGQVTPATPQTRTGRIGAAVARAPVISEQTSGSQTRPPAPTGHMQIVEQLAAFRDGAVIIQPVSLGYSLSRNGYIMASVEPAEVMYTEHPAALMYLRWVAAGEHVTQHHIGVVCGKAVPDDRVTARYSLRASGDHTGGAWGQEVAQAEATFEYEKLCEID